MDIEDILKKDDESILKEEDVKELEKMSDLAEFFMYEDDEEIYKDKKEEIEHKCDVIVERSISVGSKKAYLTKAFRLKDKISRVYWKKIPCDDLRSEATNCFKMAASYGYGVAMSELGENGLGFYFLSDEESFGYELLLRWGDVFIKGNDQQKAIRKENFENYFKNVESNHPSAIKIFINLKNELKQKGISPPWISV